MSKSKNEREAIYSEGLLNSEADVPDGYEAIGGLHNANKPLHSFVLRACNNGRVRRYRVRDGQRGYGKYFVYSEDLARVTKEWESLAQHATECDQSTAIGDSRTEAAVIALCEINNGIALMLATLERLTTAVENIAKQPEHTARLRQDIVATCDSANGFHN